MRCTSLTSVTFMLILSSAWLSPPKAQGLRDQPGGADYLRALRTADEFLAAWIERNEDKGLALISHRLRRTTAESDLRSYISGLSNPSNMAFAIGIGVKGNS